MQAPRFVDDYLLALLARASHAVSAEFHGRLKAQGIKVPVWRVLATLSDGQAMTVGTLAAACVMQQPTMTKLLDRMERDGLVRRRAGTADRRLVEVRLTARGSRAVAGLLDQARAHEAELLANQSRDEALAIRRLLRNLIARHAPRG